MDSSRLRSGGRFAYTVNEYSAPSLRGDTGIGELGLTWAPSATLPLSVDLGVQGYVGTREGVSGNLQITWEF